MDTETYNGWTNRATWLVALWLDNEYELYTGVKSMPVINAATLKKFVKGYALKVCPGFKDDMKTVKISDVNWDEIVKDCFTGDY